MKYYIIKDANDNKMNIIILATDDEIKDECITGEYHNFDTTPLTNLFEDTGYMCECYLIHTLKTKDEIKSKMNEFGFAYDKKIKECGWC